MRFGIAILGCRHRKVVVGHAMGRVRTLVWLRRDLRLHDHAALAAATQSGGGVAVAFVFDRQILDRLPHRHDRRLTFIHASLAEVDAELRRQGSALLVGHGDPVDFVPRLARALGVAQVVTNGDTEPYAKRRDRAVSDELQALRIGFERFRDQVIFTGRTVASAAGEAYRVFTPYRNAWRARFTPADAAEREVRPGVFLPRAAVDEAMNQCPGIGLLGPLEDYGFAPTDLWLEPGAAAGTQRLETFRAAMPHYARRRDRPDLEGTSGLSVHLRHGTVSVRQAVRAAQRVGGAGGEKWLDELIWREFYQMILAEFPHVVDRAFRPEYDRLTWPGSEDHLQAWTEGRTGYPIVDAAMRCFQATGWMHNRLRMVVASFLTKDLLVDYRRGEAVFADGLLDFDLASNNGGWQWASSTGCDAQPYFRIFSPVRQSERFDPDGTFIRRWVPELAGVCGAAVHWPHGSALGLERPQGYPAPIVDHATQRTAALRMFAEARESKETAEAEDPGGATSLASYPSHPETE